MATYSGPMMVERPFTLAKLEYPNLTFRLQSFKKLSSFLPGITSAKFFSLNLLYSYVRQFLLLFFPLI